ncbi:MAG: hypothetical protein R3E12_12600 [Candidatus Eisenbacteria bacterium]
MEATSPEAANLTGVGRRDALKLLGLSSLAGGLFGGASGIFDAALAHSTQGYSLPPLPYDKTALTGFLSAEILEIHHDKHHAGYVKGLTDTLDALAEATPPVTTARSSL